MTDPSQSRNQETRKLVRTQVMKIFARERRLRDTLVHSSQSPERPTQAAALSSCRIICECPSPGISPAPEHPLGQHTICSNCHGSVMLSPSHAGIVPLSLPSVADELTCVQAVFDSDELAHHSAAITSAHPSLNQVKWPIPMEPYMLELISHGKLSTHGPYLLGVPLTIH